MAKITQGKLLDILIPILQVEGVTYKKYKQVFARIVRNEEMVETINSLGLETQNLAKVGSYVVMNDTDAKEQYVVDSKKFKARYTYVRHMENGLLLFEPKGQILAVKITKKLLKLFGKKKKIKFIAAWDEIMRARENDFFACPLDLSEIYSITNKEFFETYKPA